MGPLMTKIWICLIQLDTGGLVYDYVKKKVYDYGMPLWGLNLKEQIQKEHCVIIRGIEADIHWTLEDR